MKYLPILLLTIALTCPSSNASVTLSFSGTYDTGYQNVFGEQETDAPYSYSLTYDASLGEIVHHFNSGDMIEDLTTPHDWYGYSAAGVTETSFTFGTFTWTSIDFDPRFPTVDIGADLWFDTDISITSPTRAWIGLTSLENAPSYLEIGGGIAGETIYLSSNISTIYDNDQGHFGDSYNMRIDNVPEPSTSSIFVFSAIVILIAVRMKPNKALQPTLTRFAARVARTPVLQQTTTPNS